VYAKEQTVDKIDRKLYYKLHKFSEKSNRIILILDEEPSIAGIDPNHLLIDRMRDDNIIELTHNK